jgi:NADH-quinone oxidoreductase subunit D
MPDVPPTEPARPTPPVPGPESTIARAPVEWVDFDGEEMLVNMGPQHPSTHGVLRVVLRTSGEVVTECIPHIGYLHRCAEKIGENVGYQQFIPYTDRMDYLAAMNNNLAWALAVEKLARIEVPPRGQYVRTLVAEFNRIASHLVAFGAYGLDLGAVTPFLYAFREREVILDLFEAVCGARLTYSYIRIGGVMADLPDGWTDEAKAFLDDFEAKLREYDELLTRNHVFVKRTANIGVLDAKTAIAYGCTGPMLRGSGVARDLRKRRSYLVYDKIDFQVPVGRGEQGTLGDCFDRYVVRMREMFESVRILRQCLQQLPDGPVNAKMPRTLKVPPGEHYFAVENPRGELGFYIIADGTAKPYRARVRSPSFCNLSVLPVLARGCLLADMPALIGSIDVVMGEVDR